MLIERIIPIIKYIYIFHVCYGEIGHNNLCNKFSFHLNTSSRNFYDIECKAWSKIVLY